MIYGTDDVFMERNNGLRAELICSNILSSISYRGQSILPILNNNSGYQSEGAYIFIYFEQYNERYLHEKNNKNCQKLSK